MFQEDESAKCPCHVTQPHDVHRWCKLLDYKISGECLWHVNGNVEEFRKNNKGCLRSDSWKSLGFMIYSTITIATEVIPERPGEWW